jgi:F-type H+-transporting ATPase subunit b
MLSTPEFWVAVSFVLFVALVIYMGVPGKITAALDARADRISKELAEANRLREEAQALLAEYQQKRKEAEAEAEAIVAQAKAEAEAYATEARAKLKETVERRTRLAEQKIAQAEVQAVKEVQSAATELAVSAAADLIAAETKGAKGAKLIDASIAALKTKLN